MMVKRFPAVSKVIPEYLLFFYINFSSLECRRFFGE